MGDRDISRTLDVNSIIKFVDFCTVLFGFRGLITFHYYNEPLESIDDILGLVLRYPGRVSLWTNGLKFHRYLNPIEKTIIEKAHDVVVTRYEENEHLETVLAEYKDQGKVIFNYIDLDNRADRNETPVFHEGYERCGRPNWELITDYHGYVHLCCADYTGETKLGNILTDNPFQVLEQWNAYREHVLSLQPWSEETFDSLPLPCKQCVNNKFDLMKTGLNRVMV